MEGWFGWGRLPPGGSRGTRKRARCLHCHRPKIAAPPGIAERRGPSGRDSGPSPRLSWAEVVTQTLPGRGLHPAPSPGRGLLAPGAGFCSAFSQVRVGVHRDTWIVHLESLSTRRDPPQGKSSLGPVTFRAPGAGTHAGRGFGRRTRARVTFGEALGGRPLLCAAFWGSRDLLSASEPPSPGLRDPPGSVACGTVSEPDWCRPGTPAARVRLSPGAPGSLLHTFAAHLLVGRRGGWGHKDESRARTDLARDRTGWHRLPGRKHASATGLFQEAGGRPRGAGGGLCAPRRWGEPGWVWVPRGRVEARVRFRAPREGREAQAGPGQGLREAFFGEGGPGVPGGREVKALAGERARCATLRQVRAAPPAEVPRPPRASGRSLCCARVQMRACGEPEGARAPRPCGARVRVVLPRSRCHPGRARASRQAGRPTQLQRANECGLTPHVWNSTRVCTFAYQHARVHTTASLRRARVGVTVPA